MGIVFFDRLLIMAKLFLTYTRMDAFPHRALVVIVVVVLSFPAEIDAFTLNIQLAKQTKTKKKKKQLNV